MNSERGARPGKKILWGVFLILFGAAFLVERLGVWGGVSVGHDLWPLVFFVIGAESLIERRPGNATMFFIFGAWFLACNFDLWGLTIRNSWPITLIAVGAGVIGSSLSGEDARRRRPKQEVQNG